MVSNDMVWPAVPAVGWHAMPRHAAALPPRLPCVSRCNRSASAGIRWAADRRRLGAACMHTGSCAAQETISGPSTCSQQVSQLMPACFGRMHAPRLATCSQQVSQLMTACFGRMHASRLIRKAVQRCITHAMCNKPGTPRACPWQAVTVYLDALRMMQGSSSSWQIYVLPHGFNLHPSHGLQSS